ncbi:MAG: hypothetical protein P8X90_07600 [Desulfobacterales bacterium]|jgi:hypothetical protein
MPKQGASLPDAAMLRRRGHTNAAYSIRCGRANDQEPGNPEENTYKTR